MTPTNPRRHAPPWIVAPLAAFALSFAALLATAHARTVGDVLAALEASAATIVDLEFVLEGVLIDLDGQTMRVEVEVLAIPGIPAAGLYILRPDAIADNQVIIDGDVVKNYTFLTNQISLFDIDDPDALGGLIEVGPDGELPVSLDLAAVFAGWNATLVGEEDTPRGPGLLLRFDNLDPAGEIRFVLATVIEDGWDPWRLAFFRTGDQLFADVTFRDLVRNQGLTREQVTYLPEDAEVLDRRRR